MTQHWQERCLALPPKATSRRKHFVLSPKTNIRKSFPRLDDYFCGQRLGSPQRVRTLPAQTRKSGTLLCSEVVSRLTGSCATSSEGVMRALLPGSALANVCASARQ